MWAHQLNMRTTIAGGTRSCRLGATSSTRRANASSRKALAVMYAGVHGAGPDGIELRRSLSIVCDDSELCTHVKFGTGLSNAEVHAELRAATFCLEPQGDTPFRSQVFECLVRSSPPGTVVANPASRWP